ncbi:MAG TPA: hypothetical protein VES01_09625 [Dermatophilaceae bacterium]|nr:hypothetical protein [Dermatophilaceae bacterium]
MSAYVKKTNRRRYEDRSFSVRAVHRDRPDLHKLAEVLIRLTLQETGSTRAEHRAAEPPDPYRPTTASTPDTAATSAATGPRRAGTVE